MHSVPRDKNARSFRHARLAEADKSGGTVSSNDDRLHLLFDWTADRFRCAAGVFHPNMHNVPHDKNARSFRHARLAEADERGRTVCNTVEGLHLFFGWRSGPLAIQTRGAGLAKPRFPLSYPQRNGPPKPILLRKKARSSKCLLSKANARCGAA